MKEKEVEKMLETLRTLNNVDLKKVMKVIAKIQRMEGKEDKEINKLLEKWEEVYDDAFKEQLRCSFCNKSQNEVRKLIAGPGVYICDECIELCCEILEEELKKRDVGGESTMASEQPKFQYGRELPSTGEIWRHFKGNDYKIISCPVTHTETKEICCVYQALYGDYGIFCRPLSMFMSEVDRDKYPQAEQKYRFEKKG